MYSVKAQSQLSLWFCAPFPQPLETQHQGHRKVKEDGNMDLNIIFFSSITFQKPFQKFVNSYMGKSSCNLLGTI